MTDLPPLHWTENEELLEQYLLDRVDPGRSLELESHLRSCTECRKRVEAEEALIGGVRRLGRDQLRKRLASRTRLIHPRLFTWQQLAAAAVFIIASSIGVYQWWVTTQKKEEAPAPATAIAEDLRSESGASKKKATDAVAFAGKEPAESTGAAAPGTKNNRAEADRSSPVRRDIHQNSQSASTPAESPKEGGRIGGQEEVPAAEGGPATKSGELSKTESTERPSTKPSLWVEGTILPGESTEGAAANRMGPAKAQGKGPAGKVMRENKEGGRQVSVDSQLAQKDQPYSLHQRPFSTLSNPQRQLSSQTAARRVLTQIERVGDSLSLTVYLDTLYDGTAWAGARIRRIGTDSLTIHLPGQRIGYKLPPGWNSGKAGVLPARK